MAIGPVQLIVLGFEQPDFHGESSLSSTGWVRATPYA